MDSTDTQMFAWKILPQDGGFANSTYAPMHYMRLLIYWVLCSNNKVLFGVLEWEQSKL